MACLDGKDNDGDGDVDFPDDLGCIDETSNTEESPVRPRCNDKRDNDGDGLLDYPADPGCATKEVDEERDDCPSGPLCPQCSNKVDDDISGFSDYPNDMGCESAADNFELIMNPIACGATLHVEPLPINGRATGTFAMTSTSNFSNSACSSSNGSRAAVAYVMVLSKPKVVVISTSGSSADTVLTLRKNPCQDMASEIACHADNGLPNDRSSRIVKSLAAGVYYIIVQLQTGSPSPTSQFMLNVEKLAGEGEKCNGPADCGPGLICRIPHGETEKVCSLPVCGDGRDDDEDGKPDHPDDPGCSSPEDPDESDDCPDGPNCPECADEVDNDHDTFIDYPMDPSCKAAGDSSEACTTSESITVITSTVTNGNTTTATNDYDPVCNASGGTAGDLLYRLDLPAMSTLGVRMSGYDGVHSILDSSCGGTPISCSDGEQITINNLAAGTYFVVADGWFANVGAFTLTTTGTVAPGGSCEGQLFQAGVINCGAGFVCDGTPGARTCRSQCTDGLDNNNDGKTDFPNDPGCSAPGDNSEDTVCPGASCPQCADTVDNDVDGQIDYPADTSCLFAGGTSESCVTSEAIVNITAAATPGTTAGQTNDFDPTCNSTINGGPDVMYRIDLPAMATLNLNLTTGFDTVHSLLDSTCNNTLMCSDSPQASTGNLAAGTYFVAVDAWSTGSGTFTLNTSGTIAAGGSCESPLFTSGVITCQAGFVCTGAPGDRRCITECTDGIDNNADGKTDFPNDPGCSAPNDNSENTVCPGAACPVCSDTIDNDLDTLIDFPQDNGCVSAGASSESCVTSEPIAQVLSGATSGTTAGSVNDYKPVCGNVTSHTAGDVMLQLDIPQMQSLTLSLNVPYDSVHVLLDSTCGSTPINCSDSTFMSAGALAAGRYFVVVDGWSGGTGTFTLNTSGTIAAGGSCETPLFPSSFSCASGTTCQGPTGARRCTAQCSDGVDNNGDGTIDFPNDPSCTSLTDNTEVNVTCPGASCPVCSNTTDDDTDTLTDFPSDFGCVSAAGTTEAFCAVDPNVGGVIAAPQTSGTLAAPAAGNYNQTCQNNTGNDVVYSLQLPVAVQSLRIDTAGSAITDTVLSLKDANCNTQFACNDDGIANTNLSLLNLSNVAPGNYAIQVDSYNANGANNGAFKLNVKGTVAPGTVCTSPLFAANVLTCGGGTSCTAGTCQ